MAPLYKRYIPPKPGAATGQTIEAVSVPKPAPPPRPISKPVQNEEPLKRKRDRTGEEVAERKAKKLRKKGIDPATVDFSAKPADRQTASQPPGDDEPANVNPVEETKSNGAVSSQGGFSHIKDSKKRHKLEKEARKARIAAEKQAKGGSENPEQDGQEPGLGGDSNGAQIRQLSRTSDAVEIPGDVAQVQDEATAPTRRKKRRKSQDNVDDETTTSAASRERNEKPQRGSEELPGPIEPQGQATDLQAEEHQYNVSLSQPKKRRHKLESVLEQSNNDVEPEDDEDEHLKKHGSIVGKFQKSQKASKAIPSTRVSGDEQHQAPQPILRDLVPLPQPEKAPTPEFKPDPNALPVWLAKPTVVADDKTSTFAELGLDTRVIQHLSKLGFKDALPVQQALIPLLLSPGASGARYLPGTESVLPDIAVGAPTGSGKTIAYLLPIIEALKRPAGFGKLKALVVVPTRELVMQVAAVAESLAKGSKVKIGVATGTGSFSDEPARLIRRGRIHDPQKYQHLIAQARRLDHPPPEHRHDEGFDENGDFEDYLDEIENLDVKEQQLIDDTVSELEDHVPTYESNIDILVATPGRLLEHLDNTLGFNLAHLEWLVLDEADKLLDGQYSNFLGIITAELQRPHMEEEQDARERYLRSKGRWIEDIERRVRKVVLSATMTRDISKLMDLKLKRPQMVLVRGKDQTDQQAIGEPIEIGEGFELPHTLKEYSVHVGDGSEKPLFLLQVLKEHIVRHADTLKSKTNGASASASEDSDVDSSSDSDDSSDSSDSSSETSSNGGSSAGERTGADTTDPALTNYNTIHPSRAAALEHKSTTPTVLIFTSSTESASRLSHLLITLTTTLASSQNSPLPWIPENILTLTSTTPATKIARHLSNTPPTQPILAITTDRAARGLDALGSRTVTHVVQYDVPRSATNYVHRVGRTARAGRGGEAWTLFTHSEARWFVGEVVRGKGVRRLGGVEKVKVVLEGDGERAAFARAVEGLRDGVLGGGKEKRRK